MMNLDAIMKLKKGWEKFTDNHPKFPMFLKAVQRQGVPEGTVVAISLTYPDGKVTDTNIRITASDLELFESLKNLQ